MLAAPPDTEPIVTQLEPSYRWMLLPDVRMAPMAADVAVLMDTTSPVVAPETVSTPPFRSAESLSDTVRSGPITVVLEVLTAIGAAPPRTGIELTGTTGKVEVAVTFRDAESVTDHVTVRDAELTVGFTLDVE